MANNRNRVVFFFKTVFVRIMRAPAKSILTISVIAIIMIGLAQVLNLQNSYRKLCEETEVNAKLLNALTIGNIQSVKQQEFCEEIFYEMIIQAEIKSENIDLIITNDLDRYTDGNIEIEYCEGYSYYDFLRSDNTVVISRALRENRGIDNGDNIYISPAGSFDNIAYRYYVNNFEEGVEIEEISQLYYDEIINDVIQSAEMYTVIGIINLNTPSAEEIVFSSGRKSSKITGNNLLLEYVEIHLSTYKELEMLKNYGEYMADLHNGSFIINAEKIESLMNTLTRIEMMYPYVVVLVLIVIAVMTVMLTQHNMVTLMLMRLMGEKKIVIVMSFLVECVLLNLIGNLAGLIVVFRLFSNLIMSECIYLLVLNLVITVIACVVWCSFCVKRSPLELLQMKE